MIINEIIENDKAHYMNIFGPRTPLCFTHGAGAKLYAQDGQEYIDFLAGIAVNCLGYGDEGLANAIASQAQKLIHCSNLFYNQPQIELATRLFELSGGYKVFFCNSGAEANEGAIKLARKYFYNQGKPKYQIISAQNSFHGRTLATVAATGQEKYQAPYAPLPGGFKNVPYNSVEAIENAICANTAAVLLETIQGEGGVIEADPDYLAAVKRLCEKNDVLLIFDEVQTGCCRTGKVFSFEHFGIQPDIFTLAKGLGGGVPIGATLALPHVADAFSPGDHGSTFGGNPLACAAANYVLSTITKPESLQDINDKSEYFKTALMHLKSKYKAVVDVRGKGLLLGLELSGDINGKELAKTACGKGFIINCAGHNTLRFAPPFVITKKEIDALISVLEILIKEASENGSN